MSVVVRGRWVDGKLVDPLFTVGCDREGCHEATSYMETKPRKWKMGKKDYCPRCAK